jgi:hypothetical protein
MRTHLVLGGLVTLGLALLAQLAPAVAPPAARSPGRAGDRMDDVAALAKRIDRHVNKELEGRKVVAAPRATDSEFVRRVYLDLAGRIPRVSEVRDFLDDKRPDKRTRLVEKLIAGPNYVTHFTNVWRALLLPTDNNQQFQGFGNQVQEWVRGKVRDNVAWDKLVRELITTPVGGAGMRGFPAGPTPGGTGVPAFFQANENKPENLAAATSRLFLGVKIECAQCHDHPFAKWTRKQFWEYTAFFAGIKAANNAGAFGPVTDDTKAHEIAMPGSEKKVTARFLDGSGPAWTGDEVARRVLADWMVSPSNPFFARAAANRMWEHFFGIGLVDPADDFREENPASHPELLDELAKGLIEHNFDLKFLIRAITSSQAYNRTSQQTDRSQEDLRAFARVPLKGLSPEQVFDSLATAVGYRGEVTAQRFGMSSARNDIQGRFANPVDRRTEWQTSILQALSLMNGRFIADATSLDRSETLAAVIDSPFMDTKQKLDTLYMAALARPMRGSEAGRLVPYVDGGGPSRDPKRALADVFWVLLNSSEFILNH